MAKYKAGKEPGTEKKKYRKPDRLKADGSKDDRNWPVNSPHKKAQTA